MSHVSPFRRLEAPEETVGITVDGHPVRAAAGESIAAALLAAGYRVTRRTAKSDSPRGPYCMMGACYECQVLVDGALMQACMTPVAEGMAVHTIDGFPGVGDA
ncbi:MAG: (2Fe-2S)-binding protein [Arhodomonas sp.]|nr:(2Fe-2S)-binding protein [Arhodomonas sp.]